MGVKTVEKLNIVLIFWKAVVCNPFHYMESPIVPTARANSISGIQKEPPTSMLGLTIQKPKSSPMTSNCTTPFSPMSKPGERTCKPRSDRKVVIPVSKIMDAPWKPLTVTMTSDEIEAWKQVLGGYKQSIYNMCAEEWVGGVMDKLPLWIIKQCKNWKMCALFILIHMEIQVPTIFDPEYASIASHQSSWVAYEIAKNINKLRKYYEEENIEEFKNVYKECLLTGSQLRAKLGTNVYGENIDNELFEEYKEQNNIIIFWSVRLHKNEHLLPKEDIPNELYTEYYMSSKDDDILFQRIVEKLKLPSSYLLINHNQKSFIIITVSYPYKKYIVCSPFSSKIFILTYQGVIDYILTSENPYSYLLLMFSLS